MSRAQVASTGPAQLVLGLMSGTSLDGVDGVLGAIDADGQWQGSLAHAYLPFDAALRALSLIHI